MSYNDRRQKQCLTYNADQTELESIKSGSTVIDVGSYNERTADALDAYKEQDERDEIAISTWQREDLALDNAIGGIHKEIDRRDKMMGHAYPFALKENTLQYRGEKRGLYEFLLSISGAQDHGETNIESSRLFERVTAKIAAAHLGAHARSFHMGSPRDDRSSFKDAMQQLSKISGEFTWQPEEGHDSKRVKDEGCDFVVWLEHADKRQLGQLFILGQCACGNNWETKWNDLQLCEIKKWCRLPLVLPVRAFSTPHHVVDDMLREAHRTAGLFFDRARLTMVLASCGDGIFDSQMRENMDTLTRRALGEL